MTSASSKEATNELNFLPMKNQEDITELAEMGIY